MRMSGWITDLAYNRIPIYGRNVVSGQVELSWDIGCCIFTNFNYIFFNLYSHIVTTKEFVGKITDSNRNYPDKVFASRGKVYTCVNPYYYHIVRKNPDLYEKMDGLFVDGMTMCWWLRILWGKKISRLSFDMSSMAAHLFDWLDRHPENGGNIYFIGAKEEEIGSAIDNIHTRFPNLNIAGFRNGYFKDKEERERVIKDIVKLNPAFTIVGMGSPMQESFALELKESGYKGVVFTCGGFLHQTSQRMYYYPQWVNKYNMRAFYRLFHEKGLVKRLYNVILEFPVLFAYDSVRGKIG